MINDTYLDEEGKVRFPSRGDVFSSIRDPKTIVIVLSSSYHGTKVLEVDRRDVQNLQLFKNFEHMRKANLHEFNNRQDFVRKWRYFDTRFPFELLGVMEAGELMKVINRVHDIEKRKFR